MHVMEKHFPYGTDERHLRGGHFLARKAAAITLWKTKPLPMEMMHQIPMACEPSPCFRRLFVSPPQWKYVYQKGSLLVVWSTSFYEYHEGAYEVDVCYE